MPLVFSLAILFSRPSHSHFILNYRGTLGFDASNEDSSHCGAFSAYFPQTSDNYAAGDSIILTPLHLQSSFLFHGTLDMSVPGNWTILLLVVGEHRLGTLYEATVQVPVSCEGAAGVIQVIQDARDGIRDQVRCFFIRGNVSALSGFAERFINIPQHTLSWVSSPLFQRHGECE